MEYIFRYDMYIKVNRDLNEDLIEDQAYVYEDKIYLFKGNIDDYEDKDNLEAGIYLNIDENDEEYLTVIEYKNEEDIITVKDIISLDTINKNMSEDIYEIGEEKDVEKTIKREKPKIETKKEKENNTERVGIDDILNLEINDNDDELTKIIKGYINDANITRRYIDNQCNGDSYNIYYGLRKRNSMAWSTFVTWCDILDLNYEIIITKK